VTRLLDLTVGALALLLFSPLLAAAAVAIRLEGGGPALYRQRRVGRDGEIFELLKLRTMVPGSDPVGVGTAVTRDDPRVTRVGRLLRRLSLDEVPNLINVLRGEMSIVGPRPEQLELVERYAPEHQFRLQVKPGITGPMQVYGRGELTFDERLAVEREYVENLSLVRDIRIVLMTLPAVFGRRGAF
jgi:lipopolysaccharide/colanic/teichoic acid biosynthesis glycosyltransferase